MKEKTLKTFIVGNSNQLAVQSIKTVTEHCGQVFNPLLLHSPSGTGKTHLVSSVVDCIQKNRPECKIYKSEAGILAEQILDAIKNSRYKEFYDCFIQYDIVILENIDILKIKEFIWKHICDLLKGMEKRAQIILTAADEQDFFEQQLSNMFPLFFSVGIEAPEVDLKEKYVKDKLKDYNLELSDQAINMIAELTLNMNQIDCILRQGLALSNMSGASAENMDDYIVTAMMKHYCLL